MASHGQSHGRDARTDSRSAGSPPPPPHHPPVSLVSPPSHPIGQLAGRRRVTWLPFGEPLVDIEEWNDNAPLPQSVFDVPPFASAEVTCSKAFLNGGRMTYNGKESHIMSVVNARLNKNVVRRAADRLLKIAGFGRTPTAKDTIEKVIPLRDLGWVPPSLPW